MLLEPERRTRAGRPMPPRRLHAAPSGLAARHRATHVFATGAKRAQHGTAQHQPCSTAPRDTCIRDEREKRATRHHAS
eukprot:4109343-Pyramimonas_sp.AAC.1